MMYHAVTQWLIPDITHIVMSYVSSVETISLLDSSVRYIFLAQISDDQLFVKNFETTKTLWMDWDERRWIPCAQPIPYKAPSRHDTILRDKIKAKYGRFKTMFMTPKSELIVTFSEPHLLNILEWNPDAESPLKLLDTICPFRYVTSPFCTLDWDPVERVGHVMTYENNRRIRIVECHGNGTSFWLLQCDLPDSMKCSHLFINSQERAAFLYGESSLDDAPKLLTRILF